MFISFPSFYCEYLYLFIRFFISLLFPLFLFIFFFSYFFCLRYDWIYFRLYAVVRLCVFINFVDTSLFIIHFIVNFVIHIMFSHHKLYVCLYLCIILNYISTFFFILRCLSFTFSPFVGSHSRSSSFLFFFIHSTFTLLYLNSILLISTSYIRVRYKHRHLKLHQTY